MREDKKTTRHLIRSSLRHVLMCFVDDPPGNNVLRIAPTLIYFKPKTVTCPSLPTYTLPLMTSGTVKTTPRPMESAREVLA